MFIRSVMCPGGVSDLVVYLVLMVISFPCVEVMER